MDCRSAGADGTPLAGKGQQSWHDLGAVSPTQNRNFKPSFDMNASRHPSRHIRPAGLVLALTVFVPALLAQEPVAATAKAGDKAADQTAEKIEAYKKDPTELSKAEAKAALAQIDAELEHLDRLADAAPTPQMKTDAQARYVALKERRNGLGKDFNRARYDAFMADLQAEKDRLSAWAKETFQTKPAASAALKTTAASADQTAEKIAEYRTESSDLNKAEVKSALARLDADIDLLAVRIDAISDPDRKADLNQHLAALKTRRNGLNSEFRKARYDALVADVKSEWDKLVN